MSGHGHQRTRMGYAPKGLHLRRLGYLAREYAGQVCLLTHIFTMSSPTPPLLLVLGCVKVAVQLFFVLLEAGP